MKAWKRQTLIANASPRTLRGLWRPDDCESNNATRGGDAATRREDAVLRAIRAGYRIVDKQVIEKGTAFARSLRGVVDRSGGATKGVDGVEQLSWKSLQFLLEWVQTLSEAPSLALKRLTAKEQALLGKLTPQELMVWIELMVQFLGQSAAGAKSHASPDTRVPAQSQTPQIVFEGYERAVELIKWTLRADATPGSWPVIFRKVGNPTSKFDGTAERNANGVLQLTLRLTLKTAEGTWKASICDENKNLLGIVVVEL